MTSQGEKRFGICEPPWTSTSATATSAIMSGLPTSERSSVRPGDERGHEALGVAQEGHDLRPDAGGGGRRRRLALAVAVDAEQRRVLAREPHHEVATAVADAQVVVGDAAAERLGLALGRAEHVVEGERECHQRGATLRPTACLRKKA